MLIIVAIVLLLVLPSPWSLVAFIVLTVLWIGELFAWNATVKKRRRVVGAQTLIGREAVVSTACRPVGQVRLDGEIWAARCDEGADVGDRVRIVGREQLTLSVERVAPEIPA
jgi:membrane-bound serine protease (ClpP class)